MKAFPMFIRTTDRQVIIVGGGEQAAQKARLLLKTDAHLVLVAASLDEELAEIVAAGKAQHRHDLSPNVFEDAAMAFIGTGCPAFDAAAHTLAKAARCPVNVVDQPELCDITTPAIVDRDPIVIAIGSEGTAPVLTRRIKTHLEQQLPQTLGGLAALAGRLRPSVSRLVPREHRRALWAWVFKGAPYDAWVRGAEREAALTIKDAIAGGGSIERESGQITFVDTMPGARDLLTLRAVERLQEADVIFADRLVDNDVLELARRDSERVMIEPLHGVGEGLQAAHPAQILEEARKGRRVVRVRSVGADTVCNTDEEVKGARESKIPVEVVPVAIDTEAKPLGPKPFQPKRNPTKLLAQDRIAISH